MSLVVAIYEASSYEEVRRTGTSWEADGMELKSVELFE